MLFGDDDAHVFVVYDVCCCIMTMFYDVCLFDDVWCIFWMIMMLRGLCTFDNDVMSAISFIDDE